MNENRVSLINGSLLWVGAAISIAEILTGAFLAPLGFGMGMLAILLGHFIGCALFFFVGLMGAKSKTGAMESVGISFGRYGSIFFSILNILQLIGWTAVMIISGANALAPAVSHAGPENNWIWCLLIGLILVIWVAAGLKNIGKLNSIAVIALFFLCIMLGVTVFSSNSNTKINEIISFGLALELSIAMPISWLPLISDYSKNTDKPVGFTLVSSISYFVGSSFMYIIGLGAALFSGASDINDILTIAGPGLAAALIVILSTVTTAFLDVYSAAESLLNIRKKWNGRTVRIAVCILGTLIALYTPIEQYENFLYLIGSVFVPMAAIMITDYFINKNTSFNGKLNVTNTVLWVIGFVIYRMFLNTDTLVGSTVPVVLIIMLLCILTNLLKKAVKKNV